MSEPIAMADIESAQKRIQLKRKKLLLWLVNNWTVCGSTFAYSANQGKWPSSALLDIPEDFSYFMHAAIFIRPELTYGGNWYTESVDGITFTEIEMIRREIGTRHNVKNINIVINN